MSGTTTSSSSDTDEPETDTELVTETGAVITDEFGNPILVES